MAIQYVWIVFTAIILIATTKSNKYNGTWKVLNTILPFNNSGMAVGYQDGSDKIQMIGMLFFVFFLFLIY